MLTNIFMYISICIMRHHIFTENQRNFIISESPKNDTIDNYVNLLKKNSINLVINLTEHILYDTNKLKNANIDYLHLPVKDGDVPTDDKLKNLILFLQRYNSIAFHCVAGIGRAPLFCALTFIILFNYKPLDIITKIREKEPSAFNTIQINYLLHFRRNKYVENSCIIT